VLLLISCYEPPFLILEVYIESQGSSISIAAGYWLEDRGSIPDRQENLSLPLRPDELSGPLTSSAKVKNSAL
jgi:hypothetical protein